VSLVEKALGALAVRWVKGKVDGARRRGSEMQKLLDGNKRLVVTLGFILAGLITLLTGRDVGTWLDLALRAFGWTDAALISGAKELATQIVPLLFAIWAAVSGLWKMWRQHKAGATTTELSSPVGVVKAALADGSLAVASPRPATLVMTTGTKLVGGAPVTLIVEPPERPIALDNGLAGKIPSLQTPKDRRAVDVLPREGE
jgi:hypothetical protein